MADNFTRLQDASGTPIGTDDIAGVHYQVVKVAYGEDGSVSFVSDGNPLPTTSGALDVRFKTYEDTSFVTGDSPVVLDVNTDLGRDGRSFNIENTGGGNMTVAVSNDGVTFSDEKTLLAGRDFKLDGIRVDSIRLTWVANTSYLVTVF